MIDNLPLLQNLLSTKQIELENSSILKDAPNPLPENFQFDRIEGMLLGLAVGDALGNTTEARSPLDRKNAHGEIRNYLPNRYADFRPVGLPSDDTQMAFWTLEQLLADAGLVPDHLASKFTQHQIYGIGSAVRDFLRAYKDHGKPWVSAGQPSAGNGALMRIAPVLIPHLREPSPALWADAALAGMVTHNDRASNACCIAFTHILWECLRMEQPPEPVWWVDTFSSIASQLEGSTSYTSRHPEVDYIGPLWQFVDREVRQAIDQKKPVIEACEQWYSGAYLLETMPCVLYILAMHADQPEQAIIRAVNDTRDNDSVAAVVGAALGALHGRAGIPARWIHGLLGRIGPDDDWRIYELIEDAKQVFWQKAPELEPSAVDEILTFLPLFEQADFRPGKWVESKVAFPYFDYAPEVLRFIEVLYRHNFVIPFDWANWEEGKRLTGDLRLIDRANLQTLRKLMTMHLRADRFTEGHLAHVFETGEVVSILKRIAEVRA